MICIEANDDTVVWNSEYFGWLVLKEEPCAEELTIGEYYHLYNPETGSVGHVLVSEHDANTLILVAKGGGI